jgi:hypothetical protein
MLPALMLPALGCTCRTWQMGNKLGKDLNCAAAAGSTSYDMYLGDGSASQQASADQYLRAATSMGQKYGWELTSCSSMMPYICEVAPERCGAVRSATYMHL